MCLKVRFLAHAYKENSVGKGEHTLCVRHVHRRKLIIINGGGNFISISCGLNKKGQNFSCFIFLYGLNSLCGLDQAKLYLYLIFNH
jgi:hypothetical protein